MKDFFLVLTKDNNYYSESERAVFVSKFYSGIEKNNGILIEENIDREFVLSAQENVKRIEEKLIDVLSDELNEIHELDFSRSLWDRMLNVWTTQMLHNIYFKYSRMKYIMEKFDKTSHNLHIATLFEHEYQCMIDITECTVETIGERYDFQLWSRCVDWLAPRHKKVLLKRVSYVQTPTPKRSADWYAQGIVRWEKGILHHMRVRIKSIINMICNKKFDLLARFIKRMVYENLSDFSKVRCILYYPGFSPNLFEKIIDRSNGRVLPLPYRISRKTYKYENLQEKNECLRNQLRKHVKEKIKNMSDDDQAIMMIALQELPRCYVELFRTIRKQYEHYLSSTVKYIISMHGAYMNTGFLFYAMEMSKRFGCEMRGIQHGGDYQLMETPFLQDFFVSDKLYCWGKKTDEQFIPSSSLKISSYRKQYERKDGNKQVLFLGGGFYRPYLYRGCVDEDVMMRINMRMEFLNTINVKVKERILLREDADFGWEVGKYTNERFPELRIDDKSNEFLVELSRSELCVCEYIGTPWIETLVCDKPLIVFYEGNSYRNNEYNYREKEKKYLSLMEDAGILYTSPVMAAKKVNEICDDIDSWWNESKRQEVVKIITDRYWNDFGAPDVWWEKEIISLVDENL